MSAQGRFVRTWVTGVLGVLAFAAVRAPLAHAGESEARHEFARGVSAYDAKDYAVALDAFRHAYSEKPSPGIQRNIALCLRAMHRDAEAVDTLEEMLAKGGDAIDLHTREAARKAIDEMNESLATIRVRLILQAPDARMADAAGRGERTPAFRLSVDDADVPTEKRAVLRVDPGEHTLRVRVDGYAEGMARINVSAGEHDRLVEIPLVAIVSAPSASTYDDVPPPPALYAPDAKSPPPQPDPLARRWMAAGGLTVGSESRTLGGGAPTSAPFSSVGFTLRVGWKLSRFFNVEGLGEIGSLSAASTVANGFSDVSVTTWSLAPELRFHTTGKVRFIVGAGAGIFGQRASWQSTSTGGGASGASGTDGIFLAEIGGQIELGRWLLELDGITDVHGVDRATASNGEGDLFTGGTARRTGIRATLGYTF